MWGGNYDDLAVNVNKTVSVLLLFLTLLQLLLHFTILPEILPHHPFHCKREEEVVQLKDDWAFCDSHAATDPCGNLISSHYVSAGPVALYNASMPAQ